MGSRLTSIWFECGRSRPHRSRRWAPKEAAVRGLAYLFFVYTEKPAVIILALASPDGFAIAVAAAAADPT
jgi:hypothetical protein